MLLDRVKKRFCTLSTMPESMLSDVADALRTIRAEATLVRYFSSGPVEHRPDIGLATFSRFI